MAVNTWKEIRDLAANLLADPRGDVWTEDELNVYMGLAFDDVTMVWESFGKSQTIVDPDDEGGIVTIVVESWVNEEGKIMPPPREHQVVAPDGVKAIRRLVGVVRTDGTYHTPLAIVPFFLRNNPPQDRMLTQWYHTWPSGVYVYRSRRGLWFVGFIDREPQPQTIEVTYLRDIDAVAGDDDEPKFLPPEHRKLVAYKTAVLALIARSRESGAMERLLQDGLHVMVTDQDTPSVMAPNQCRSR